MSVFTRVARGRLAAWLTVAAAIVVAAAVFGTPQPDNPAPVSATGLSVEWQSTQVQRLQDQLPSSDVQPAIVVVSRGDRGALSDADRASVDARAGDLRRFAVGGQVSPAQVSPDGTVALIAIPIDTAAWAGGRHRDGDPAAHRPGGPARADRRGDRLPRLHRRPLLGVRRRRHHPARGDRSRRGAAAADHLPQPVPVDRAAGRGRGDRAAHPARGGHHRPGRRHQPPAGPGHRHRQCAGLRRRHRLRPAAHRPLPGGAAARGRPVRGDARRAAPHRRAHPRQRRHRDPRCPHPAAQRAGDQPGTGGGLRHRCALRHALGPVRAPRRPGALRSGSVLAVRAPCRWPGP